MIVSHPCHAKETLKAVAVIANSADSIIALALIMQKAAKCACPRPMRTADDAHGFPITEEPAHQKVVGGQKTLFVHLRGVLLPCRRINNKRIWGRNSLPGGIPLASLLDLPDVLNIVKSKFMGSVK